MRTFDEAARKLQGSDKSPWRNRRKIGRATYLVRVVEPGSREAENALPCIALHYHETDIAFFYPEHVQIFTDGWTTVTTKQRLNEHISGARIFSERGTWFLSVGDGYRDGSVYPFAEGITLHADGSVTGEGESPFAARKLRTAIDRYAKSFIAALRDGKVSAPGLGDCMACGLRETESKRPAGERGFVSDHIASHIGESYFVPSLLHRACEVGRMSQYAWWTLGSVWDDSDEARKQRESFRERGQWETLRSNLRRYLYTQCGLPGGLGEPPSYDVPSPGEILRAIESTETETREAETA